jgi:hypothetical protein
MFSLMKIKMTLALLHAALAIAAVTVANGEVVKSNQFRIPAVGAKGARSAILALPDETILAFVVSPNADWRLYRVHNWVDAKPSWDSISISTAFVPSLQRNLRDLQPRLLKTSDNRFVLCVTEAGSYETRFLRVTSASSYTAISVVDLETFKPIANVKLASLNANNFHVRRIDQEDQVLIENNNNVEGIPVSTVFLRLTVPSLSAGSKCEFHWARDASARMFRPAEPSEGCKLSIPKGTTLDEYIK